MLAMTIWVVWTTEREGGELVSLSVCFWQSERCGFLAGKDHLGSQPLPQLRKLPKELMELVLLLLSQVFFFLIFHYLGVLWFAFILIQHILTYFSSHIDLNSGASSGLGAETTRVLTLRGVHVIMAVRNTDAGKNVKEQILKENPNAKIDVMELDLTSMGSVRKFASDYNASGLPLNLLM